MLRNIFLILFLGITFVTITTGCGGRQIEEEEFVPPVFPPPPAPPRFIYERTIRSSADVKEVTAVEKFKLFATGSTGRAYGMAKPYGIAVYQGRVYVTDTVQRLLLMFDFPGRDFKAIGTEGLGQLLKPIGVAVDRNNGTIYVADNTAKRVVVFDKDGEYLRAIGGEESLRRPSGVAVSPDGSRVYVVDTGGVDSSDHHLQIYDSISGALIKTVGTRGSEQGEFNLPLQGATGPDGTIYVVDGGNFRVQSFKPDGSFKQQFGAIGRKSGQFSRPKGIATDLDGNIYVVDASFGNFQIFNSAGELLLHVGDRGKRGKPAEYMLPAGIAVDEDGRIYMVDQYFKKIDIYRPYALPEDAGFLASVKSKK